MENLIRKPLKYLFSIGYRLGHDTFLELAESFGEVLIRKHLPGLAIRHQGLVSLMAYQTSVACSKHPETLGMPRFRTDV